MTRPRTEIGESSNVRPGQEKGMKPEVYSGALKGSCEQINQLDDWIKQLTPTGNNILHIHVGKPLCRAANGQSQPENANIDFINKVLDVTGDNNTMAGYNLLLKKNDEGDIPLHLAARFGHIEAVKKFLERAKISNPEDVSKMLRMPNKKKDTPLHEAARAGHAEVVEWLVQEHDHDLQHEPNEMYETPLYLAAESGSTDSVVKILNASNALALVLHDNRPCGRTPLHAAVQWGDLVMVAKMLEKCGDQLKKKDDEGWTPIHFAAAESQSCHHLKKLLDHDKSKNDDSPAVYIQDKEGRTALHVAILKANLSAINMVIAYRPDCVEITDNKGQNVIHYAAKKASAKVIMDVLELGHFEHLLNKKDVEGNTPLHILAFSILGDYYRGDLCYFREFIDLRPFLNLKAFNNENKTFADIIAPRDAFIIEEFNLSKVAPRGKRIYSLKVVDVEKAIPSDRISNAVYKSMKEGSEARIVVATLIATVSFTSALALPGGFQQSSDKEPGKALLNRNAFFIAFLITDIIAFVFSTIPIVLYFILAVPKSISKSVFFFKTAYKCMKVSVIFLAIALVTGITAVVTNVIVLILVWLLVTCLICSTLIVFKTDISKQVLNLINKALLHIKLSYYKRYVL